MPDLALQETAVEAVIRACRLCETVRSELVVSAVLKQDRSPVTVADLASQAVVSSLLESAFPDIPLTAEEETSLFEDEAGRDLLQRVCGYAAGELPHLSEQQVIEAIGRGGYAGGTEGRFWTLDPIDGTKGFLRSEQYAVALALIEGGEVVFAVLGCPNLPFGADPESPRGSLFAATRGGGAWTQLLTGGERSPIRVDAVSDPREAVVCESVEAGHSSHSDAAAISDRLGVSAPPIRMDSQCKYGLVARGDASIYLRLPTRADYQEKIWDHAAGMLVITEAGGRVTDVHGKDLDFSQGRTLRTNVGVVATNGALHAEVLAAVQATLSEGD